MFPTFWLPGADCRKEFFVYTQAFVGLLIDVVWPSSPITFFALRGTLDSLPFLLYLYILCVGTNTHTGYCLVGELRLGPFGLVHRLSDLGGILSYVQVGQGAIAVFTVDGLLLLFALAFQPGIV